MSEEIQTGIARIIEVMHLVADDCESDALALDGKLLDSRTLGEQFGQLYAAVQAVAKAVIVLASTTGGSAAPEA